MKPLTPAEHAAWMALALRDLIDKRRRNSLPVPAEIAAEQRRYQAWAAKGGAVVAPATVVAREDVLLTYGQVANLLQCSSRSVQRLVHDRKLTAVRDGRSVRFRREDVHAYLADHLAGSVADASGDDTRRHEPPFPPEAARPVHAGPVSEEDTRDQGEAA